MNEFFKEYLFKLKHGISSYKVKSRGGLRRIGV